MYAFLQGKGYDIVDEIEAYDGIHGVFMHDNADCDKYAKVGYHEGNVIKLLRWVYLSKNIIQVLFSYKQQQITQVRERNLLK